MSQKLAISSMSLGRCFAGHCLTHRLDMAQKYGYKGIELFHEDLAWLALFLSGEDAATGPSDEAQLAAAHEIHSLCQARSLEVVCLQPFIHYDGLVDRAEHEKHMVKLDLWIKLAQVLDTDLIQVPANFLPADHVTTDLDLIVSDLQKIADIGLKQYPPIRFAYESLCWSTRVDTWEQCWDIVQLVDRPNFGICLDTFNIAGRIYADPACATGKTADADEAMQQSIARLVATVDVKKVFYVQVVDAERLDEPLIEGHPYYDAAQPPRMSWSRNCRLFYGEKDKGAYLPITEVAAAFFHGLGFEGWVSLELFNRRMGEKGLEVPEELARRGAASWVKLVSDLNLNAKTQDATPTKTKALTPTKRLGAVL